MGILNSSAVFRLSAFTFRLVSSVAMRLIVRLVACEKISLYDHFQALQRDHVAEVP
jgi:hypothetical protein